VGSTGLYVKTVDAYMRFFWRGGIGFFFFGGGGGGLLELSPPSYEIFVKGKKKIFLNPYPPPNVVLSFDFGYFGFDKK
jgi:hypothetical protein